VRATALGVSVRSVLDRLWTGLTSAPSYVPSAADLRSVSVAGLVIPVRASIAIAVVFFAVMADYHGTFLPDGSLGAARDPLTMRVVALARIVLYGAVPLLVVTLLFRDRPGRYGLAIGDWRWGIPLAIVGCAVMTPITLAVATNPEFRAFYGPSATTVPDLVATNALDLVSAEFAFRGFLMFTLLRAIGPLGVVVAVLPFAFSHLGKPEIETISTLGGGLLYGWLAWRTRSIVYGAAAHVYILTLVILAAAP
jgi:membrane protease YdiL (CAAX protease family)